MLTKKYRVSEKRKHLYRVTYTFNDFYLEYNDPLITKEVYVNILKDFYSLLFKRVVLDRKIIKLPYGLNTFRMQKVKAPLGKKLRIDFNKTKQYGTTIYHLNNHSMGFYFRWYWQKNTNTIKNKQLYKFELNKSNKGKVAAEIFRCNSDPFTKDYDALR